VQQQLLAARDAGAAVLLISDDLDEVLALGDRIAVMHGGHLGGRAPATDWTREAIGHGGMAGHGTSSLAPERAGVNAAMRLEPRHSAPPACSRPSAHRLHARSSAPCWCSGPARRWRRTWAAAAAGRLRLGLRLDRDAHARHPLILTGLAATVAFKARCSTSAPRASSMPARWPRWRSADAWRHRLRAVALAAVPADDAGRRGGRRAAAARPGAAEGRLGVDEVVTTLLLNFIVLLAVSACSTAR
jgi:hypothetical protein